MLSEVPSPGRRGSARLASLVAATVAAAALALACPACSDPEVSADQPPVAFAGYDQTIALSEDPAHAREVGGGLLDGRRSQDPDDPEAALTYSWAQTYGPAPLLPLDGAAARQVVWLTEPGLYAFQLVVHAGGRRSAPDTVHVAVLEPTSCTVTGAEQCNGVDDDCDGATDEDLEPPSADLHEGVCVGARRRCDGAAGWIEPDYGAIEAYEPTELSCDGLDNDCDGLADEGFDADGDGVPDCLQC